MIPQRCNFGSFLRRVVNLILSSLGRDELLEEILRELTLLKEELQEGKVTIEKFEILKVRFKNYELITNLATKKRIIIYGKLLTDDFLHFPVSK
jgi:hypothetical protein